MAFSLGMLSGFNWYKWGAILLFLTALAGGSYMMGKHNCEVKVEQEKTAVAEERTRTIIKEVEVRVPVVQIREVASTKLRTEVAQLKEQLNAAINKRPDLPACQLSADELAAFQLLAGKTHAPE